MLQLEEARTASLPTLEAKTSPLNDKPVRIEVRSPGLLASLDIARLSQIGHPTGDMLAIRYGLPRCTCGN